MVVEGCDSVDDGNKGGNDDGGSDRKDDRDGNYEFVFNSYYFSQFSRISIIISTFGEDNFI